MFQSLRYLTGSMVLMCCCALTVQAETVAHWVFEEGSGQIAGNSVGSNTLKLRFGASTDPDVNDPSWDTGYNGGGAIHGKAYSENSSNNTYTINNDWTVADQYAMAPSGSYTFEALINPDSALPTWSGDGPYGFLIYRDYANSKIQYLMRVWTNQNGTNLGFYSQHADGSNTDTYLSTANTIYNSGDLFTITPGNWYYTAAIFDSSSNTLQLLVRDMATGDTAVRSLASQPMYGLDPTTPNVQFLVGSERITGSRCFDGLIDQVRISNSVVPEALRLYNGTFFPGDANNDGLVNLADLQILGDNWQSTAATWTEADFNGDGSVNLADLQILGDHWGFGVSPDLSFDEAVQLAGIPVPEPTICLILGAGSWLLVLRKR